MITDNLMKGGKERRLLELLRYFDNINSIQIKLVLLKDLVEYPSVFELKRTEVIILKRKIKKDPTVYFKLWSIVSSFRPDLVHSWGTMPSVYMFSICALKNIPLLNAMITNAMCVKYSSTWYRAKLTFPFSKIVLANSQAGLDAYSVPIKKGRVIYNGFNFDRFNNRKNEYNVKVKYGVETPICVGMVASFTKRKDYETYLNVASEICKKRNDITFFAIGDGPMLADYKVRYKDCENIVFTGNVMDVESIINILNVGVLLSNPSFHLEGISNALMEMMACGVPVIASKGGGTDELIDHLKTGILVSSCNSREYTKWLLKVIEDEDISERLSKNAINIITKKFSIESMGGNTLKLYNNIKD